MWKNYFKKEFVQSVIFEGKIIVTEPTHTLSEYLNADFFSKFNLIILLQLEQCIQVISNSIFFIR